MARTEHRRPTRVLQGRYRTVPCYVIIIVLTAALLVTTIGQQVQVLDFQRDGTPRHDTEASYNGSLSRNRQLTSLTFCFRFNLHYLHASATVFKLLDTTTGKDEMLVGILWIDRIRTMIAGFRKFQPLQRELKVNRWHHVCFLYSKENKLISSFVDGRLNYQEPLDIPGTSYGDEVWLGQGAKIGVDETSFSGQLTQVNVWDYVLTEKEVVEMADCTTNPQGNYVAWESGWNLYNINSYKEQLSTICQLEGIINTYQWFPSMSQSYSYYICEALGGRLPEISSLADAQMYHKLAATTWKNDTSCSTKFWTPLTDEEHEGDWRRGTSPLEKGDLFWAGGEPDGIFYQNCGLIYPDGMRDVDCPVTFTCAVCVLKYSAAFSFRGTCEADKRHVYFTSKQQRLGQIEFRGFGGFFISLEDNIWVWRSRKNETIIATMEPTKPNYPLGRRVWNIYKPMCSQETGARKLLFTPCNSAQFTCDNAKCISLEKRCDLKYDCLDHSDEIECSLVKYPVGYQHDLPPRQASQTETVLPITANISIKSIAVDTMLMNMFVSYEFQMTWFDNRLQYLNLKSQKSLNVLPYASITELWSPTVSFLNTIGGFSTEVDIKTSMYITRLTNSTEKDLAAPAEIEIYSGAENLLIITRKYATSFTCDFNLILYPFDDQYCDMLLQIASASTDYIRFNIDKSAVTYSGNPLLLEYEMSNPELQLGPDWEFSQLIVRVPLSRRFGYAVLNIYTPSFILLVISYVTLHFQAHLFDVRVMSVLTVLLVTATLFTQVSSSLPKTSYFKMVDVWLLFCIVMNFLLILLHVCIDYTYHVERNDRLRSVGVTKVQPIESDLKTMHDHRMAFDLQSSPNSLIFNIHLKRLVLISKALVLTVFLIFSFCYWGYILF